MTPQIRMDVRTFMLTKDELNFLRSRIGYYRMLIAVGGGQLKDRFSFFEKKTNQERFDEISEQIKSYELIISGQLEKNNE